MNLSPVVLVARVLWAPILVAATALLVKGYVDTGGGFSAGMVAGLGVLLQYLAYGWEGAERRMGWSAGAFRVALGGLALMAAVLLLPVLADRPPAWHLPRPGAEVTKLGPLELHTAFLFEVGVALATFGFVVTTIRRLGQPGERQPTEGAP